MHAALHILGYKVYDLDYNFYHLGKQWLKILSEKGGTKEDFYNMYKDVDATMDVPACNFWEEILEAFPDVKASIYRNHPTLILHRVESSLALFLACETLWVSEGVSN